MINTKKHLKINVQLETIEGQIITAISLSKKSGCREYCRKINTISSTRSFNLTKTTQSKSEAWQ